MKVKFDKEVEAAEFKKNNRVWLVPRDKQGALQPRKLGPFEISKVEGSLHVRISQTEGGPSLRPRAPEYSKFGALRAQGSLSAERTSL